MSETIWDIIKSKREEYNPALNDASHEAVTAWEQQHGSIDADFLDKLSGLTLQANDEGGLPFVHKLPTKLETTPSDAISDPDDFNEDEWEGGQSPDDQKKAEKKKREGLKRHEKAVKKVMNLFEKRGFECIADTNENDVDWDVYIKEEQLLFEVKDTWESNGRKLYEAYGQLDFYEHTINETGLGVKHKFGLFTKKPRDDLIEKFEAKGNFVTWFEDGELTGTQRATDFLESIGIDLNK